jgi:uncharacterized protein
VSAPIITCGTPAGALRVRVAYNFVARARGLLFATPLSRDEGLLIAPCSSIHTFGMGYPIDVIFLDRRARIVRVYARVPAGRVRIGWGAAAVLETLAGQAACQGLVKGVQLDALRPRLASPWHTLKRHITRLTSNL